MPSQIVELLLEHGADVTVRNFEGQTAIEVASPQMRRTLLDSCGCGGARRNILQAAWQGNAQLVKNILVRIMCGWTLGPLHEERSTSCWGISLGWLKSCTTLNTFPLCAPVLEKPNCQVCWMFPYVYNTATFTGFWELVTNGHGKSWSNTPTISD